MRATLREGFSTGTAAAAAANAAVQQLFGKPVPSRVMIELPPFPEKGAACLEKERRTLCVPVERGGLERGLAWASVVKDGGDDPDATHGMRIIAHASLRPLTEAVLEQIAGTSNQAMSRVAFPVRIDGFANPVFLHGGGGIGTVTLPGLPVPPGEPAINPEPRKQIAAAVNAAAGESGHSGPLHLCLSAPEGRERAVRTLNARLGIVGGISILGTQGTVKPYSHDAWRCSIEQGLGVAAALGLPEVLLCTGRRSERLAFSLYPDFPPQTGIQVADYAAFSLRAAAGRNFRRVIWACFPGKLLKLAQGLEWTHAQSAAVDTGMLLRFWLEAGGSASLAAQARHLPTAGGILALMETRDKQRRDAVLLRLADRACANMRNWMRQAAVNRNACPPDLRLHVFSTEARPLLRFDTATGGS